MRLAALLTLVGASMATNELAAADAYFSIRLTDVQWTEGELPAGTSGNSWRRWRIRPAMRPYARVDGEGEAYVEIDWTRWTQGNAYGDASLSVRSPGGGDVTGSVYIPRPELDGMDVLRFRLPADRASPAARVEFLRAKEDAYRDQLSRDVPGAAWFRHQSRKVREARGVKTAHPSERTRPGRLERPSRLEDTFLLFTGGRAVSENLQLDRALPPHDANAELVPLDSIPGITVAEIDWKPLVEGLEPKLDALASNIPADQHALFFPDFRAMVSVLDEAKTSGTPIIGLLEPRAEDANTKERYETQLCLSVSALARTFGPHVVASVAMTGSDPYLRLGTDVAILFEAKQIELMQTFLGAKHAAAVQSTPGAKALTGDVAGVHYRAVVTDDRRLSSYVFSIGDVVVVTNSLFQMGRIVAATNDKTPALARLDEYKYFRDRYQLGAADESAFLMLSDATIRRWCGPRWRIADSRRTRAAAMLGELQASQINPIARRSVETGPILASYHVPGATAYELTPSGVRSEEYGSVEFLTPIAELEFHEVTRAEADAYGRWRDGYQRNWRRYFDPIAIRLTMQRDRLAADLTVLPLIAGSDYRQLVEIARGMRFAPDAGDPHPGTLFHAVLAVDRNSAPVRQFGSFAANMAPGLDRANPLGWLGKSVAFYADVDPFWAEVSAAENPERFLEGNLARLPLALRVEVSNSLTAAVFLSSLRAFVEQSAPGMTRWENLELDGVKYVKVSPTEEPGFLGEDFAIFYAVSPRAITLTLNESLLHRAIRRDAKPESSPDGRDAPKASDREPTTPAEPWLGESLALRASQGAARMVEALSRNEYQNVLRMRSWSSLPILNEWKRLYPNEDPVALHERLWGVRLVCPGGGRYQWNAKYGTMESTAYGHPGEPKSAGDVPWPLRAYRSGDFGITFEEQGVRARVSLQRGADTNADTGTAN